MSQQYRSNAEKTFPFSNSVQIMFLQSCLLFEVYQTCLSQNTCENLITVSVQEILFRMTAKNRTDIKSYFQSLIKSEKYFCLLTDIIHKEQFMKNGQPSWSGSLLSVKVR